MDLAPVTPTDVPPEDSSDLDRWVAESTAAVAELARVFELRSRAVVIEQPEQALGELEAWLRDGEVSRLEESDGAWLASHLMAYLAHLLIHLHGGRWRIDDIPDSPTFGRHVVGAFPAAPERVLDPAAAVLPILSSPRPSIIEVLADAEQALGLVDTG